MDVEIKIIKNLEKPYAVIYTSPVSYTHLLTLWTLEARTILEKQDFPGICFQKFQENILVSGIDFSKVNQGDCLVAGKVRLKVEKKGKRCHPEVCTLGEDRKHCLLRTQTVFLKPLSDGILSLIHI